MEGLLIQGWTPVLPGRVELALGTPGWGFHIVRGGIDPGDRRFRPRGVGIVDVWKAFSSRDGPLSSPAGCS